MKRSEMVDKIDTLICDAEGQLTPLQLSERILNLCEECGMQPPSRRALLEDVKILNVDQKFLDEHEWETNQWEKEDG